MLSKKELFNAKASGQKIEKGLQIDVVNVGSYPDTDKDGNPVPTAKGWALKGNRGKNRGNGVTVTREKFDVAAVSGAYLARVMASGDLNEITRFSMLKPSEKVAFLATTPEYDKTVTTKSSAP